VSEEVWDRFEVMVSASVSGNTKLLQRHILPLTYDINCTEELSLKYNLRVWK